MRLRGLLGAGLSLLVLGGCDLSCDLSEACFFGRYCPNTGRCGLCCKDSECPDGEICSGGSCWDSCPTRRCKCGFMELGCEVVECCLGDPGCECCFDEDCPGDWTCEPGRDEETESAGQVCVEPCLPLGDTCGEDSHPCCEGLTCHPAEAACVAACAADEDCLDSDERFAADLVCEEQLCLFVACQTDADCLEHQSCFDGVCLSPAECDWLAYCQIAPDPVELQPGEQVQLDATAFMRDQQAVPAEGFGWSVADPDLASVEPDGLLTAGAAPGRTSVTAGVLDCPVTCSVPVAIVQP